MRQTEKETERERRRERDVRKTDRQSETETERETEREKKSLQILCNRKTHLEEQTDQLAVAVDNGIA